MPARARLAATGLAVFGIGVFGQAMAAATELVIVPIAGDGEPGATAVVDMPPYCVHGKLAGVDRPGWDVVTDVAGLREVAGLPLQRVADKVQDRLHALHCAFLAASPFWLLATSASDGTCNVSPKGDPAGAVLVLDDRTLALPDRPGNRRVDGFGDLLDNPHVGLVFLVPGRGDTLRINGRATLVREAPFFDQLQVQGKRPSLAVVVDVEEVFFHCAKAFLRSRLWDPATWNPDAVPSRAEMAKALDRPDASLEELQAYYGPAYGKDLY